MTAYDKNGVRAEVVDGCAVALYVEGALAVEMTLEEFNAVHAAIMEVKE